MRFSLFLFLISLLFLTSCKKKELTFTLKGTITDGTYGGGLANATVKLYEIPAGSASPSEFLGSAELGSDGKYSFTFKRNVSEAYYLKIEKTNYFTAEETISFSAFSTESDLEKNYSLKAKGWIRLSIQNTGTTEISDLFQFTVLEGLLNCSSCAPSGEQKLYGAIDTSFVFLNNGDQNFKLVFSATGQSILETREAITPAFDTTEMVFTY